MSTQNIARMTLRINGLDYGVRPLGIAKSGRSFKLYKKENGSNIETYTIYESPKGTICDCPDFRSRRAGGKDPDGCKHIKALRAFFMVN